MSTTTADLAESFQIDENSRKNELTEVPREEWEIVRCLNRGQYGAVFVGRRTHDGCCRAMKCAHTEETDAHHQNVLTFTFEEAEELERLNRRHWHDCSVALRRERSALERIHGGSGEVETNVVRHFGFVEIDDVTFLSMELMDCNLAEYLYDLRWGGGVERSRAMASATAIPSAVMRSVATQTLAALRRCRDVGIIHCDLKPGNVLVRRNVERTPQNPAGIVLKLADFGMCKTVDPSLRSPRVKWCEDLVTIQYRAPELLFGLPFGYGIDVWAWGCMMAEMISQVGRLPFGSPTAQYDKDTVDVVATRVMERLGVPTQETWPGLMSAVRTVSDRETRDRLDALFKEVRPAPIDTFYCGSNEIEPDALSLDAMLKNRVLVWPHLRWSVYKLETHLENLFQYTTIRSP